MMRAKAQRPGKPHCFTRLDLRRTVVPAPAPSPSSTFTVTLKSFIKRFLPLGCETLTFALGTSARSENVRRSAVNRTYHQLANVASTIPLHKLTECAQPASFPQSSRKWSPMAQYVAGVSDFNFPLPNL